MKKVCYITTTSYALNTFVLESAKYLHKKGGYQITFICDYDKEFEEKLPDYIEYIPVRMERGMSSTVLTAIFILYKIFKSNKYDLVQYSTPNASLPASLASCLARVPVRLYCQWGIFYTGKNGIKRQLFKGIERVICFCSTWIEPDSKGNLEFSIEENLYKPNKATVLWNGSASGIDLDKFEIENKAIWRDEIFEEYNISLQAKVVGFVGRINKDKGVRELLEAMDKIMAKEKDVVLFMIGEFEDEDLNDNDYYQKSLHNERIIYTGTVPDTERYYASMNVFVLPSYREGFGSVVIEAEAMGVPVVVTDIPGPTDAMIKDETGLIVEKRNVEALNRAIQQLIDNESLANEFGRKGHEFAVNNFDAQTLFKYILEDRNRLMSS